MRKYLSLIILSILLAGCSQSPDKEMIAANKAKDKCVKEQRLDENYNKGKSLLVSADVMKSDQDMKSALLRTYVMAKEQYMAAESLFNKAKYQPYKEEDNGVNTTLETRIKKLEDKILKLEQKILYGD